MDVDKGGIGKVDRRGEEEPLCLQRGKVQRRISWSDSITRKAQGFDTQKKKQTSRWVTNGTIGEKK